VDKPLKYQQMLSNCPVLLREARGSLFNLCPLAKLRFHLRIGKRFLFKRLDNPPISLRLLICSQNLNLSFSAENLRESTVLLRNRLCASSRSFRHRHHHHHLARLRFKSPQILAEAEKAREHTTRFIIGLQGVPRSTVIILYHIND
jgi:hypothetical protein